MLHHFLVQCQICRSEYQSIHVHLPQLIWWRIMFWGVSHDTYNVDEIMSIQKTVMDTAKSRHVSDSDMSLLESAFKHMYALILFSVHFTPN